MQLCLRALQDVGRLSRKSPTVLPIDIRSITAQMLLLPSRSIIIESRYSTTYPSHRSEQAGSSLREISCVCRVTRIHVPCTEAALASTIFSIDFDSLTFRYKMLGLFFCRVITKNIPCSCQTPSSSRLKHTTVETPEVYFLIEDGQKVHKSCETKWKCASPKEESWLEALFCFATTCFLHLHPRCSLTSTNTIVPLTR